MSAAATPAPDGNDVPVVGSFAVAAQLRRTTTGTTARVSVVLPEDVKATPATLVPALLSLGQQVLIDHRLTGHELPEVDVTAVERVETVPATATDTGFTLEVTNDLATRRSAIAVDSDLLLGNDDGVLLIAATLLAGAEHLLDAADHLLDAADHPTDPATPPRNRSQRHRSPRRSRRPATTPDTDTWRNPVLHTVVLSPGAPVTRRPGMPPLPTGVVRSPAKNR